MLISSIPNILPCPMLSLVKAFLLLSTVPKPKWSPSLLPGNLLRGGWSIFIYYYLQTPIKAGKNKEMIRVPIYTLWLVKCNHLFLFLNTPRKRILVWGSPSRFASSYVCHLAFLHRWEGPWAQLKVSTPVSHPISCPENPGASPVIGRHCQCSPVHVVSSKGSMHGNVQTLGWPCGMGVGGARGGGWDSYSCT